MTPELYVAIVGLINDIQKQMGKDNPVAQYVRSAVLAKLTRDKMKEFIG